MKLDFIRPVEIKRDISGQKFLLAQELDNRNRRSRDRTHFLDPKLILKLTNEFFLDRMTRRRFFHHDDKIEIRGRNTEIGFKASICKDSGFRPL